MSFGVVVDDSKGKLDSGREVPQDFIHRWLVAYTVCQGPGWTMMHQEMISLMTPDGDGPSSGK